MPNDPNVENQSAQQMVLNLIKKHRLVEDFVHKQDMPRHDLVESLVRKQNLVKMQQILNQISPQEVSQILEELPPEDQLFVWDQINDERKELILQGCPDFSHTGAGKTRVQKRKVQHQGFRAA